MKKESFGRVYDEYHKLVLHVAFDILRDYDLAEDVCQEVFIKLYEKIDNLDEDRVKGWLLRCGQRKAIDFVRRAYRKKEVSESSEKAEQDLVVEYLLEVEKESDRRQFRNFVLEELERKNQVWYELIVRVVMGNESAKAVAQEYGMTLVSMRMRISRARHWLYKNFYHHYQKL